MLRDYDDVRHSAPTRRATRLAAGSCGSIRHSGMPRLPRRLPAGRARAPVPERRGADHEADRGFNCAPGRQDDRGQHRATGAGPAAGRGRLPGHGRLPADQLPVRAAGPGPGPRRAAGRLQVKNTEQELACQLDVDLPGTRPGGPPRVIIASSRVIDARWVTSQRVPALGRRIAMTCSFWVEPDT